MKRPGNNKRPKKAKKKTKTLRCRVAPEEELFLQNLAKLNGMTLSQFMRFFLIHGPASNIKRADPVLTRQLLLIHNDLNQIARACTCCARDGQEVGLLAVLITLKRIDQRLELL
jgi:hypothetical protein